MRRCRTGLEHAILLGGGQSRVQRQHLGRAVVAAREREVRIADLALSGQEHQCVATRIVARDFVDGRYDLRNGIGVVSSRGRPRTIGVRAIFRSGRIALARAGLCRKMTPPPIPGRSPAHLDRITATLDLDDRRAVEVRGEARGVDRCRGDDQLEVAPTHEQALQITQEEVDIQAALVRFVENDRVVRVEPGIGLCLGEQDAVGHELDQRAFADLIGEAHLEADEIAEFACRVPRRRGARHCVRRRGEAACNRSGRCARAPQRGRVSAIACSCPNPSRPRARAPDACGSTRRSRRRAPRSAAIRRPRFPARWPRALRNGRARRRGAGASAQAPRHRSRRWPRSDRVRGAGAGCRRASCRRGPAAKAPVRDVGARISKRVLR